MIATLPARSGGTGCRSGPPAGRATYGERTYRRPCEDSRRLVASATVPRGLGAVQTSTTTSEPWGGSHDHTRSAPLARTAADARGRARPGRADGRTELRRERRQHLRRPGPA